MVMLSLLRPRQRQAPGRAPLDGFCKGECLPLPPGEIFAEEGVLLFREASAKRLVVATHDEAWVAVRLDHRSGWYALWCPDAAGWEVLNIEVETLPEPAAECSRRRAG